MNRFIQWAGREHSLTARLLATLPAGVLFVYLIPAFLIRTVPRLDALLGLPRLAFGAVNFILGGILILAGAFYAQWSIYTQFAQARGTPIPVMPTKTLLVSGPFRHCRNPMALGTFLLYLGVAVLVGSPSSVIVVLVFAALLILYIKRVEERELEARFGDAYLDYKSITPFILPRIR